PRGAPPRRPRPVSRRRDRRAGQTGRRVVHRSIHFPKGGIVMSLKLYFHPLSSFCHKVLVALYETGTPFEPRLLDLFSEIDEYKKIWPIGKIPVLRDEANDRTIPETSIIIEYLAQYFPGKTQLFPTDRDLCRQMRLRDRVYDLYVNVPMQKIVTDRLRPE